MKITKKQIQQIKKYLRSKQGRLDIIQAGKDAKAMSHKLFDGMIMTPEKWNKIKDIPYDI